MLPFSKALQSWLENLRFPWLLLVTFTLFILNVFIPDALPMADELLLALSTVLLARMKRRKPGQKDTREQPSDQD